MAVDYDIIVVGAGPAGSTTAEHAAAGGASVLILERKKVVGEPMACGEFIPAVEEMKGSFPKAEHLDELFDLPEHLVSQAAGAF